MPEIWPPATSTFSSLAFPDTDPEYADITLVPDTLGPGVPPCPPHAPRAAVAMSNTVKYGNLNESIRIRLSDRRYSFEHPARDVSLHEHRE